MTRRNNLSRACCVMAFALLLALVLVGCGILQTDAPAIEENARAAVVADPVPVKDEAQQETGASPPKGAGTSAPRAPAVSRDPTEWEESTLKERILKADVVVRARMTSKAVSNRSSYAPFAGKTGYFPYVEFTFTVVETLKGTAASTIVVELMASPPVYAVPYTATKAEQWATDWLNDYYDPQWEDRDAILFLADIDNTTEARDYSGRSSAVEYGFIGHYGLVGNSINVDDDWSIRSKYSRSWLPANSTTAGAETFYLESPDEVEDADTVTLSSLKSSITSTLAEVRDSVPGHRECLIAKERHERIIWPAGYKYENEFELASGSPAGTVVTRRGGPGGDVYQRIHLFGDDAPYFDTTIVDADSDPRNGYDGNTKTVRPLPARRYVVEETTQFSNMVPCGYVPSDRGRWTFVVTAPVDTLHELFFDPVTVGSTVAADATNGVLKPSSFTDANDSSATIGGISYESSTVKVEVTPNAALAGHIVDIIKLDGTVSLSLDDADATVDDANDTLSWSVSSQPWEDGDLLMVRIREAPPEPVFESSSYTFDAAEDAEVGTVVGTVSATDPGGGAVTYAIIAGNEDGKFAINSSTGAITVAAALDYETTELYTLTVEASSEGGGSATATVEIGVTDVAEDAPPAPAGLDVTLSDGTFAITWNAVTGAARYEAQHHIAGSVDDWTSLPETTGTSAPYSPTGGPACGTTYEFRVRAYGDGTTFAAVWGAESSSELVETEACNRAPEFNGAPYLFKVSEDASVGDSVGTVSATDADEGDTVTYTIASGNEAGKFGIGGGTGEITVAGVLDHTTVSSYRLTVEASDGNGGTATAGVTIGVADASCSGGIAVPDPVGNPGLVSDCETLLGLKDALSGDVSLNWRFGVAMRSWDGVTVGSTPSRVTELDLRRRSLTGVIPPELGDLPNLQDLNLSFNQLTGGMPTQLGSLSNLDGLWLENNQLSGGIPSELGSLSNLVWLILSGNGLTGPIPPELGDLTILSHLWLQDNQLSGELPSEMGMLTDMQIMRLQNNRLSGSIPWQFGNLTSLLILHLSGNMLEGCVPPGLRDVGTNDFASLDLPYCTQEGPVPAPKGLSVMLSGGTFTLTWSVLSGAGLYEAQHRVSGTDEEWTSLPTTEGTSATLSPEGGPSCEATYEFRVRAYGDGVTYAAAWGAESEHESVSTGACNSAPVFDAAPYTFSVSEDVSVGDSVGTVSATDADEGDTVTYSITGGNEDEKFAIDDGTGEITVAVALDYETDSSYTLTVEASDGKGGNATATVRISVTDVSPEDLPPAPEDLTVSLADGTFTITWSPVIGAARYEAQHHIAASDDDWTSLPETAGTSATYSPADGPSCGTTYEFRVRTYGDGTVYVADWGAETSVESVSTSACNRVPSFGASTYSFTISENAAVNAAVGTVSATDPDVGDTVAYTITAGNDAGKFTIASGTGAITVAGALDPDATAFYALTMEASDGRGGVASARVGIALILTECKNGTVVPRPALNPGLVRDCSMLLAARDTLAGDASLDWSADTRINDWQGVTVHPTPSPFVRVVLLTNLGLTGSIPAALGGLEDVRRIDLDDNMLTGGIPREMGSLYDLELLYLFNNRITGELPAELGELSNLKTLSLSNNMLSGNMPVELGKLRNLTQLLIENNSLVGGIPAELGDLSKLRSLYLSENMLTGGIPAELGKLSRLTQLLLERNSLGGEIPAELGDLTRLEHVYLRNNGLTGAIPAKLGELSNLTHLYLSSGNAFTGCIPSGLRDVANNDLDGLGLPYCATGSQ